MIRTEQRRRLAKTAGHVVVRIVRFVFPTLREVVALVASFTIGASVLWLAGGPASAQGPGDSLLFAEGRIFAPTVRGQAEGLPDRLGRGLTTVADPLIPTREVTELGDQWRVRATALQAVNKLTGKAPEVPVAATKSHEVHGGSSGLAWSLASLQRTQAGLTGGRVIAASATMMSDGTVGPVGGLEFKVRNDAMLSADIMFVFHRQTEEARGWFVGLGYEPVVIGVADLRQATAVLCVLAGHGPVCDPLGSPRTGVSAVIPPDRSLCAAVREARLPMRCSTTSERTLLRNVSSAS